jgi:hypothetical protein
MRSQVGGATGKAHWSVNMTSSEAIDEAVSKALLDGNTVEGISTGWEKAKEVVHMRMPLSGRLRMDIEEDHRLRHWVTERTPHNKAQEGYTDDSTKVVILFPR